MISNPFFRLPFALLLAMSFVSSAVAGNNDPQKAPPISDKTRIEIVRLLNAEYVWVRKPFPMGETGLKINTNGEITPGDIELRQLVAKYGPAARPGERAQITNVLFKNNGIWFELNGGPKKKSKWYQRIEIGSAGGSTVPAAQNPKELVAKGSYLVLQFPKYIPEISLTEIKEMVKPVLDFTVKSAAQAYTESLPENVRNAIRDHKVLVGMNKEMVTYAKGRPPQRLRDREGKQDYEEWIFGTPPEDVEFIRFVGDQVTQVKTMTVDGQKIVKTQPEVQLEEKPKAPKVESKADDNSAPKPKAPGAPTLRRPGEALPDQPGLNSKAPNQQPTPTPDGSSPPPVPKGPGI
ncbi:MAG: hypothetical protein JWO13_1155 [Acidobacteriales bacterium]|nr:hypothetical protein [Terriglobales bacterium]